MSQTKRLLGLCHECGGPISFPAELIGTMTQCPRCGKQTELFLAPSPEDSSLARKGKIWAVIAAVILIVGVGGPLVGLKRFEKWAANRKLQATGMAARAGLGVSTIALEKASADATAEAVGSLTNMTDRRRFGVKVEIDLVDASGLRTGGAIAAIDVIEPRAVWVFRVPVSDPKAVSARLASFKEGQ